MVNSKRDGYIIITNSLFNALLHSNFSLREYKIILCIIRYSYGFNKETASLSLKFISEATGINKAHISRALKALNESHVITIYEAQGTHPQTISLNKNYDEWDRGCRKSNSCRKSNGRVAEKATLGLPKEQPIQYNNTIQEQYNYIEHLPSWFDEVWNAYPNKKGKNKITKKSYFEIAEAGKDKLMKCIENIKTYKEQRPWYEYQHGSTFFNGGWKDYAEGAEIEEQNAENNKENNKWD